MPDPTPEPEPPAEFGLRFDSENTREIVHASVSAWAEHRGASRPTSMPWNPVYEDVTPAVSFASMPRMSVTLRLPQNPENARDAREDYRRLREDIDNDDDVD